MKFTLNDVCLTCGNGHLNLLLDLGEQPLANSYLKHTDEQEETFPLALLHCQNCDHLQLSHRVNPDLLFKNYLYVSGTSKTGIDHFKWFVELSKQYVPEAKIVLDVACNDGSQLDQYAKAGFKTFGIDPAKNLLELSSRKSKVICDYLSSENIKSFGVNFDMILAQNVFAHVDYPYDFLRYCSESLSDQGCIFIQTSQANMIYNNEFDTIYHEHLSFFSVHSMITVMKRCGLKMIDILKPPIHGSSFIFVMSKNGIDKSDHFCKFYSRYTPEQLDKYVKNAHNIVDKLTKTIESYRLNGYKIIGYGAAAKGNTLLNFSKIKLDYIVDDNELKQGLFTPGMHIEIRHPDTLLSEKDKLVIVPLAWNFFDEIKQKVESRVTNVKFLRYFPEVVIV